jgi:myo-inositol-hexaphosphate 3-phosphohydrolase
LFLATTTAPLWGPGIIWVTLENSENSAIISSWKGCPMSIYDNISGDKLATALKKTLEGDFCRKNWLKLRNQRGRNE